MEVMGIAITFLGIILAYIWRSNGKLQRSMMEALLRIEEGQKDIAQMLLNQTKILERIEAKIS